MVTDMSNVSFLKSYDQSLVEVFDQSERYAWTDPVTSMFKTRQFAEMLAQFTAVRVGIEQWEASNQVESLVYENEVQTESSNFVAYDI